MNTDILDKLLQQNLDKAIEKWGNPTLLDIWMILQTPDFEDGEDVLRQGDIQKLRQLCLKLRDDLAKAKDNDNQNT